MMLLVMATIACIFTILPILYVIRIICTVVVMMAVIITIHGPVIMMIITIIIMIIIIIMLFSPSPKTGGRKCAQDVIPNKFVPIGCRRNRGASKYGPRRTYYSQYPIHNNNDELKATLMGIIKRISR